MTLKHLVIVFLITFTSQIVLATQENFYDQDKLRIFELTFEQGDWWEQLEANYSLKTNLSATLTFEGQVFEGVGVRFRGNTSYLMIPDSQKKSFNIEVDETDPNSSLMGYKTFNLINANSDPTFMREVLYSNTCREQIPSARANFVKLIINGENWGLYANVQQLNGDFIDEWFPSDEGARWHAIGGLAPRTTDTTTGIEEDGLNSETNIRGGSALTWQGSDPNVYANFYELKKSKLEDPWSHLIDTCDVLNNTPLEQLPEVLDTVLDVDQALWLCAFEIIFHDDDGHVYKKGLDYGLYYEPESGRMHLLQYDGNSCMRMKMNQNWPLFYRADSKIVPIMNRLMQIPSYRQRYLAHARMIVDVYLTKEHLYPIIKDYRLLIGAEVRADEKKLYSTDEFFSGINTLKEFITARRNYILADSEVNQPVPIIDAVQQETIQDENNQQLLIVASLDASVPVQRVQLYLADTQTGPFTRALMLDDGQGPDEHAGDLIYSVYTPSYGPGTVLRYYVEAQADDAVGTLVFDPPGAEHHVYTHGITYPDTNSPSIVINELMPSNTTWIADPQGDYDDWIELLNISDTAVNLGGMYLSDNPEKPLKWQVPTTILQPGEFALVWADEDGSDGELHANFKLSSKGESVWLYDTDANGNVLLDTISYDQMDTDTSIGRAPDGGNAIQVFVQPTPLASNTSNR